jgi:hypothetical protein
MKDKRIEVRLTPEEYGKLLSVQKELSCRTITETVRKLLDDDTVQKLRVAWKKPIVKEILKRDGITLETFNWKNYKPTIEVLN